MIYLKKRKKFVDVCPFNIDPDMISEEREKENVISMHFINITEMLTPTRVGVCTSPTRLHHHSFCHV